MVARRRRRMWCGDPHQGTGGGRPPAACGRTHSLARARPRADAASLGPCCVGRRSAHRGAMVSGDDRGAWRAVCQQLLRRRQPRALRDDPVQCGPPAMVLFSDSRRRPLTLDAGCRLLSRTCGDLGARQGDAHGRVVAAARLASAAACVLHAFRRQATAVHPASAASAGDSARAWVRPEPQTIGWPAAFCGWLP